MGAELGAERVTMLLADAQVSLGICLGVPTRVEQRMRPPRWRGGSLLHAWC